MTLALISTVWFSFMIRIFELPYEINTGVTNGLGSYTSAVWLVIITGTTVGYGDIYPITIYGKATAICIALWGTFMVSMMVLVVT